MPRLIINQLGPITHCELDIKEVLVFTGAQASGKSTVAKSMFFFKNIKNILYEQLRKEYLLRRGGLEEVLNLTPKNRLMKEVRSNFLQIFGSTWCMDNSMYLMYKYSEETFIRISLKDDPISPNYIWIEFSNDLSDFINSLDRFLCVKEQKTGGVSYEDLEVVKNQIEDFFKDDAEPIYIPAGRSMITLLSTQLNYIYSSMDDTQRRNLDYCTQNYLERILKLKPEFSLSLTQMINRNLNLTDKKVDKERVEAAAELINEILQGEYRDIDGEERLQVSEERYVKINFASSGQQESVWILNVLFYNLLNNKKSCFIIEEPESHLFPNAQKLITEFISIASCGGRNQVFVTTHSPYILGTINNLLYANRISRNVDKQKLARIIPKNRWMSYEKMAAYYIEDGRVCSCTDEEFESIENEVIDGASADINEDYDKMVLLKEECMRRGE